MAVEGRSFLRTGSGIELTLPLRVSIVPAQDNVMQSATRVARAMQFFSAIECSGKVRSHRREQRRHDLDMLTNPSSLSNLSNVGLSSFISLNQASFSPRDRRAKSFPLRIDASLSDSTVDRSSFRITARMQGNFDLSERRSNMKLWVYGVSPPNYRTSRHILAKLSNSSEQFNSDPRQKYPIACQYLSVALHEV